MSYLIDKFKGVYRIRCPVDKTTNDFPRKLNGTLEDSDLFIDCQHGNKVFHYGGSVLQAYIPSLIRGHRIVKDMATYIYDVEENDSEVLFKFKYKDWEKIIPLLSPRTAGASISPYSQKNLPKDKSYVISEDELNMYKKVVENMPKEKCLAISQATSAFLKSLTNRKNPWETLVADMKLKGLRGKEYIHSIGKWKEYIEYLKSALKF